MNAVEIEEAISELASQPFDRNEFAFQFLAAFGNKATTIKRLRAAGGSNASDIPGGILQRSNIHLATCAAGEVDATLKALRDSPKTTSAKAKFILATDGETLQAEDVSSDDPPIACEYTDFPNHFGFFLPLAGITTVKQIRESSFDIRATGRLNKLYVELLNDNPDWAEPARRPDMNHFMARLIFCFFAEDTDIFNGEGLFTRTVEQMSARDSSDTHEIIGNIFRSMDTKPTERAGANIPPHADGFPYVNGSLFSGSTDAPVFSKIARSFLINIGTLDWKKINPDIFGSMIQAVADDDERGALGMHYTSVPNILKVLNPLFLDDLRAQLEAAEDNARKLLNLRQRMAKIRVFDPACGSGNFLVIAYKEVRAIEAVINEKRGEPERRSEIPLTNYRGIELRDFPAEIARLALIIAEYQCDVTYRGQKEALAEFLPLDSENWITCGNALRLDWLNICPPTGTGVKVTGDDLFETPLDQSEIDFENEGGETYICGNPPYLGSKKKTKEQNHDMEVCGLSKAKLLDYVAAFIIKGVDYMEKSGASLALVSTSSICQGEQVALLWPKILDKANIQFAYRPFKWANSATNNAGVYCTIVGLTPHASKKKILISDTERKICDSISPYLVEGDPVICFPTKPQISKLAPMMMGSNPVDGKRLILSQEEYSEFLTKDHRSEKFLLKYGGTDEINSGSNRWCIWVTEDILEEAMDVAPIAERIRNCESYRKTAGRDARKAAARPYAFCYSTYRNECFLNVGKVIGNSTEFVPITLRESGYVSSDAAFTIYGLQLKEFSIIASTLHRIWAESVAGRLGNGTRYGNTTAYNTFPVPSLTEQNKADLTRCAETILLAREAHFPATIADLYDPEAMPDDLRRAHDANDETLERIYIGRRFKNDTERLEKLFELYTKMTGKASGGKVAA